MSWRHWPYFFLFITHDVTIRMGHIVNVSMVPSMLPKSRKKFTILLWRKSNDSKSERDVVGPIFSWCLDGIRSCLSWNTCCVKSSQTQNDTCHVIVVVRRQEKPTSESRSDSLCIPIHMIYRHPELFTMFMTPLL